MIFWQTARTAQRARPGQRFPTRRASGLDQLTVLIDTRERNPYKIAGRPVEVERTALTAGDYAVRDADERLIAAVERKTSDDLMPRLGGLTRGASTTFPVSPRRWAIASGRAQIGLREVLAFEEQG